MVINKFTMVITMVINNKASKIYKLVVLQVVFSSLKFFETAFVVSMISSSLINESSIILAKYLPFSQLHVARFQI